MNDQFDVIRITSKGQMTLPVRARKRLNIKEGDHLAVYIHGEEIILRKFSPFKQASPQDAIFHLIGKGHGPADLSEKHDYYLTQAKEESTKQ
ncbi:AbrB/MazE/SpoVT family DNA-binding domain-containing protein [Desulfofundulus thermobenzoicus]|uniref:AbrB/MazE/SpoVT family DNA-binding domain-containing protein n=1 Tax=Desulfofundulus thermobenzoicus TaxID=29376 RepID=A0A6N7IXT4_9FIRM|nr:AbrB/MazE/SpoVT family DNA-binding domain-containing protein [Desulfofundulus thermobenzoicus]MQL53978.1 AbrB/MazE/SpoVT family DNA-binding domain-containing protein [Desulfofundulus thermobenzoicus]